MITKNDSKLTSPSIHNSLGVGRQRYYYIYHYITELTLLFVLSTCTGCRTFIYIPAFLEGMCTNGTQVPCKVAFLPNPTTRKVGHTTGVYDPYSTYQYFSTWSWWQYRTWLLMNWPFCYQKQMLKFFASPLEFSSQLYMCNHKQKLIFNSLKCRTSCKYSLVYRYIFFK